MRKRKKLIRRGGAAKWEPIEFDKDGNEIEKDTALSPSRLRLIAVKSLGYTHTEAGLRTAAQIITEQTEYMDMLETHTDRNDDTYA